MASNFGEVIEPKSRAFWDSDDEFQDDLESVSQGVDEMHLSLVDKDQSTFDNKLFILIHGALLQGFAETCLLREAVLVAEVSIPNAVGSFGTKKRDYEDDLTAGRKPPRPTKLYMLEESVIICVCSPDLKVEQVHSFVECISRWLVNSENVLALTCLFKTSYLTDIEDHSAAFIRGLSSACYKGNMLAKWLEPPNMATDAAAAVMTYCQIFKIPAVVYVVYTDSFVLDSLTAQPLIEIFSQLDINLLKKGTPTFEKRHYYGAEVDSNMYM